MSLVTKDAEVRICSRGDEGLPSLCRFIERRGGLAYRVAGEDRVHPFGFLWNVNHCE